MGKRRRPRVPLSAGERSRTRRALAVMAVTVALVSAVFLAARRPARQEPPPGEGHPHPPAAHGGTVVAVGEGDLHYHAEAVVGKRGVLTVYTFGSDAATVEEVESQVLTALVRP